MKTSLLFRILVFFASGLIFLGCSCEKDEKPVLDPGPSLYNLNLFLSNPTPWPSGGVYSITITGIDQDCNSGYQVTYTTTNSGIYTVVPPKKGPFRILVTFSLTCCTYGGDCGGWCNGGDGKPTYQTFQDYTFSNGMRLDNCYESSYFDPAFINIQPYELTDCGC